MNNEWMRFRCLLALLVLAAQPRLADAQAYQAFVGFGGPFSPYDIVGDWDAAGVTLMGNPFDGYFGHEDSVDRGDGPDGGDWAGLPLNEAGRYKARGHSPSLLTVPEHQCRLHPVTYQQRGPGGISIVKVYDPVTEKLVAYKFTGNYSLPRTIWMDGRPHPASNAPHSFEGFSTGKWVDDKLVIETTHIKAGYVRRNGVTSSDQARMVEHFVRHDGYLSVNSAVEDPLYFSEPLVRSTDFKLTIRPGSQLIEAFGGTQDGGLGGSYYKCTGIDELDVPEGTIPHYLPGKEPDELETYARKYDIPLQVAFGGPESLYPEYVPRLQQMGGYQPGSLAAVFANPPPLAARQPATRPTAPDTSVQSLFVQGKVWVITAAGQNTVVQVGDEGILVVDPGRQEMAAAVLAEIRRIGGNRPIRQIIYTSSDANRVSAAPVINKALTPDGQLANIVAHERTALRMGRARMPSTATPVDTFYRGMRQIHFNGERIDVIHMPAAHSDGDVIVSFDQSDVIAAGSILPNVTYPEIRIDDGGSLQGTVDALNGILGITVAAWHGEGGTIVVPGQGHLYDEGDVAEYREMVTIIRDRFVDAIEDGKTLDQVRAARLTRDYDGRYGAVPGPGSTAEFTATGYRSLKEAPPPQ